MTSGARPPARELTSLVGLVALGLLLAVAPAAGQGAAESVPAARDSGAASDTPAEAESVPAALDEDGSDTSSVAEAAAAALAATATATATANAAAEPTPGVPPPPCEPWPGEPSPLPHAEAADPVLSRWAAFRAAELAALARQAEARSRALAHPIWQHARCLDARRPELAAALERTRPVRLHRAVPGPALRGLRPAPGFEAAASTLALPVPTPEPRLRVDEAREALRAAEGALEAARFEEALARAAGARAALAGRGPVALRVDVELTAATAALALGQEAEASSSLTRALAASPDLELDPMRYPPKLRRALDAVRARNGSRP